MSDATMRVDAFRFELPDGSSPHFDLAPLGTLKAGRDWRGHLMLQLPPPFDDVVLTEGERLGHCAYG